MKVTERAQQKWDAIVERFRAACILHRNGKEWESRRIIKEELPPLIKSWMQILPVGLKEDAKADLRDMFTREQSIVDQGHKLQRLFKETLVKRIIPQVEARIASKYRSIYVSKLDQKRSLRNEELSGSWVRPSYGEPAESPAPLGFNTGKQKVKLGDISGMIDALQENDSDALADSILSLEDIVKGMNDAQIDPILDSKS
ncbi:hypothetical protein [Pelagicoccus sp. SDUM812003]|uniref:hypothetical protein n=1 Tax=Pelagicoccus sp. SDUM812003 TaxID=3041267 RepID=UPI00280C7C1E|nr:hypothetical protein [Pelagicoccus sp. SDUM812003]MDQ8202957.1 hypothetical protein [Pelagicoccus sp. SDUM812003]